MLANLGEDKNRKYRLQVEVGERRGGGGKGKGSYPKCLLALSDGDTSLPDEVVERSSSWGMGSDQCLEVGGGGSSIDSLVGQYVLNLMRVITGR